MTTIVVVRKGRHACIAADTLARYGSTRESADYIANAEKILQVGDTYLAPTGPASANLILASVYRDSERSRDFGSLPAVFDRVRELQRVLKEEYFLNPKEDEEDPYESIQMEMLIASPGGIFGVYPLRSIQEYTRFYAFGSGSDLALGAMHATYDRALSVEEIAAAGIEAAACFDTSTSLPMSVRTIELA